MKRWDIFKAKREHFIEYFIAFKNKKNRSRFLITAIILQKMLRYMSDFYNIMRNQETMKWVRKLKVAKIKFRIKLHLHNKGATLYDRNTKIIQQ